jgi:hypothetical protein
MTNQNKISVVKDVFTNTPHVIAVSSGEETKVKALTEYGQLIIRENHDKYENWGTPDGFVKTEFKQLTPQMEKIFNSAFSDIGWTDVKIKEIATKAISHQKVKSFLDRTSRQTSNDSFRNPSSTSLKKFKNKINKINILNYKAKTFKDNTATSSLVEKVKSHELAFDSINNVISPNKRNPFALQKLEHLVSDSKNTRLLRRGLATKNKQDVSMFKNARRRTIRRAINISQEETKSIENFSGTQKIRASVRAKFFNRKKFSK